MPGQLLVPWFCPLPQWAGWPWAATRPMMGRHLRDIACTWHEDSPAWAERGPARWPSQASLQDPTLPLCLSPHPEASTCGCLCSSAQAAWDPGPSFCSPCSCCPPLGGQVRDSRVPLSQLSLRSLYMDPPPQPTALCCPCQPLWLCGPSSLTEPAHCHLLILQSPQTTCCPCWLPHLLSTPASLSRWWRAPRVPMRPPGCRQREASVVGSGAAAPQWKYQVSRWPQE